MSFSEKLPYCADAPLYAPPTKGILSKLPFSWVPYAEVIRLNRQAGTVSVYVPCLFGLLYAAAVSTTPVPVSLVVNRAAVFLPFTFFARSAACAWNDRADYDLDQKVVRCRVRPIARGAVTTFEAAVMTIVQSLICVLIALSWPKETMPFVFLEIVVSSIYPYCKRFTHYPQMMLGLCMAVGMWMGMTTVYVHPFSQQHIYPSSALAIATVFWATTSDFIYAHQDVADDVIAGVGSMAVRFRGHSKTVAYLMALVIISSLVATGVYSHFTNAWYILGCGGAAIGLVTTITMVDLEIPDSCATWFSWNFLIVGCGIVGGLLAEYVR